MSAGALLYLEDGPQEAIERAAHVLQTGGVAVFPTDTVYGLLAGIDSRQAYLRVFELKQRPADRPLALLAVRDHRVVSECAAQLVRHGQFREMFLGGQLTLIIPPALLPSLPERAAQIQPGDVGLRCPVSDPLQRLLALCGGFTWATSVNRTGQPPASAADDVCRWLTGATAPPEAVVLSRHPLGGEPSKLARLQGDSLISLR